VPFILWKGDDQCRSGEAEQHQHELAEDRVIDATVEHQPEAGAHEAGHMIGPHDGPVTVGDVPLNAKHSTLYNWWNEQVEATDRLYSAFDELVEEVR
jgi:hypothetical protein